jgi:hypothetical protein
MEEVMEMAMPVYQIIFCTATQYFTSTADINYSQKILSLRVKKLKDQAYTSQMNTIRHRIKSAGKFKLYPLIIKARPATVSRAGFNYLLLFASTCL